MEQRNSAAANTRLRHTDWHALWSSSYAGAWCTPCSKGTFPLVNPLRGNIPLVGVHFSALLAPVTVLLYGAKTWQLVPPFEAAFQTYMAAWRLDGTPRTARQCSVYKNCPLPTPEDRLFFLLTYLKTYSLQVVQGRLFGMGQSASVAPRALACAAGRAAYLRRCPRPLPGRPGAASWRDGV